MKAHGVIIKPARKRVRPRHSGPAQLKPRRTVTGPPTAVTAVVGTRELQLARALSDTEAEARDAALLSLHTWLKEFAPEVSEGDMNKLCKGLFYCVWMADMRPVITQVIRRVVGLSEVGGWPFLSALLRCVVREWHGVDRHRVDKYYELITVTVQACVARCMAEAGETGPELVKATEKLVEVIDGEVICKAGKGASGVALHVLDYWCSSIMEPVLTQATKVLTQNDVVNIFNCLMRPVYSVLAATSGTLMAVSRRAVDRVCQPLPAQLASFGFSDKAQRDMCSRVLKKLWEAASNKATVEDCRKPLYAVHSEIKVHTLALESKGGVLPTRAPPAKKTQPAADAMETGADGEADALEGKAMIKAGEGVDAAVKSSRRRTRQAVKDALMPENDMEVEAIVADADPFSQ